MIKKLGWMMTAAWTFIVACSLAWNWLHEARTTNELALMELRASFQKDLLYRRWAAGHGGVYAPVTEKTPPNPYLGHIPERDITTPSGKRLTLINPAYMTRQVHELAMEQYGVRGHITSLKPIRPENAPDSWEAECLKRFEAGGVTEISGLADISGEPYLRLMRPMITEERCIKCHSAQGYRVGDIRGGISLSTPMKPYLALLHSALFRLGGGHALLWAAGLSGIWLMMRRLNAAERQREADEAAQRSLEDQLRHAQKLEAIGTLAGGVAHDFNSILMIITGYAHLTLMRGGIDDETRSNIEQIVTAADRAASLAKGLLAFSRKQPVNLVNVDMNDLLLKFEPFIRRLVRADIELVFRADGASGAGMSGPLTVLADAGQIEQVIMNLVTNARDAMPGGGRLSIKSGLFSMDDAFIKAHGYGRPGRYAVITIADTGMGMDDITRQKIFEPFFTTKEVGKGTGLGLATVYGIVKKHNGFINVDSEPGMGAVFNVYLPVAPATPVASDSA